MNDTATQQKVTVNFLKYKRTAEGELHKDENGILHQAFEKCIVVDMDSGKVRAIEACRKYPAANKKYDELVDKTGNAMIQAAIEEGRIPAKNEELISTLKTTFKNDPAAAQTILAAYKPQQDFHFGEKKDDKKKKKGMSDYCQEECDKLNK